jgi:nucleoside-diphosphate-sugar epimerase
MSSGGPDPITETSPLADGKDLAFIYPAEKLSIERFLVSRKRNITQLGIFRPGPLFDEHKTPLKKLVRFFGIPVAIGFGTGRNYMPFVHAADAASAVVAWLKDGREDLTVNLTPSNCLPHREWYIRWGTANGLKVQTVFIRGSVLLFAAMGASILKRILGKPGKVDVRYAIASASRNLKYNNQRALDQLGWTAVRTNRLSQGEDART